MKTARLITLSLSIRGCAIVAIVGVTLSCQPSGSGGRRTAGYWSYSCVTGDESHLVGGGDGAAAIELATGKADDRIPGLVRAVGCEAAAAVVLGYTGATRLPGRAPAQAIEFGGDRMIGRTSDGAWVSYGRTVTKGAWRGPASFFVTRGDESQRTELLPARFGEVGAASRRPLPDTFAVRFGGLRADGRPVVAAGWMPSQFGGVFEHVPWAFFAIDIKTGEAKPLTAGLPTDARINMAWFARVAASPDASTLVIATHDGQQITVGQYDQGADRPTRISALTSKGAASALAVSPDGSRVAIGSEPRGEKAHVWLIDQAGTRVWTGEFEKAVAGVHFLADGSLIIAAGETVAVKVSGRKEVWRTE